MAQLEKLAEPDRSPGAAPRGDAMVTPCGARTVAWQPAVARAMRRGKEAGASMRGERKSCRAMPRGWELTE
jgi:hypothetical protein